MQYKSNRSDSEKTKWWKRYEDGINFNNRIEPNYFDTVDTNQAFFNDDQWRNINTENMPKPVFNIIKRTITFLVASLTSSKIKVHFEPLAHSDTPEGVLNPEDFVNAQVNNLFEKFKMDFKIKDALFDSAITGDGAAHFYWDVNKKPFGNAFGDIQGEICMELIDGSNVFFGNANNPKVDAQPYIIISGRDMVKNLQEEAKRYKQLKDTEQIVKDNTTFNEQGDNAKIEVDSDDHGKALYIIAYCKKKGKDGVERIYATKSVENTYIYEDIDTGLTTYPISWMNWEKQKNLYHGKALCTGILPNQIFINRMFAMVMYHLMQTAFPKLVYNADVLDDVDNSIGAAIGVRGLGQEYSINNIAGYLEPGNMSSQIIQVLELALATTKEMLGINDVSLGNTTMDNTSAIMAIQRSAAIPLENPKSNLYEWIEDIGHILFDMMGAYYGIRPVVVEVEGMKQVFEYDFSELKNLWLNVRSDVGESSYWSEIASNQTLNNLLTGGYIDIIEFLERTSDEYIPQKEELISGLQAKMEQQQQQAMMDQQAQQEQQMMNQDQQAYMEEQAQMDKQAEYDLQREKLEIEREKVRSKK